MPRSDPLAAFWAADPPYQQALQALRAAELARDEALLEARRAGLDDDHLLAATGLELGDCGPRSRAPTRRRQASGSPALNPRTRVSAWR